MKTEIAIKVHLAFIIFGKEGVDIEPDAQYLTSIITEAERQFDVKLIGGSQLPETGLHPAKCIPIFIEVELARTAIVAKSKALTHLREPPILKRNRATEIFTTQIVRRDKILEMKNSLSS